MNCAEFEILLSDYVDGTVSIDQRRAIEAHADSCPVCREFLRDVFQAVSFMDSAEKVAPPPELITRIVYHAPRGRVRDESEYRGFFSRTFTKWLQPVLQPRFAMGMAMTILSFAMLGRCTGVQVQQIRPADLSPGRVWNNVEDRAYRSWDRTVKYYENLRLVYEIETRLQEIRDQQDAMPAPKPAAQSGASKAAPQRKGETQ
ncbi:MAG TPA: zf-HC2 domain-containing protein [Bryobacteraceae bacterium]|jgi:anti-sigma factor RsiW|nr:zf-HC2 domain-containing protein [Bryobacteraceae bacterium]